MEDNFFLKTQVYFGNKSLQYLKQIKGTKAFIVSDSIMEKLGYLEKVQSYLSEAGISSTAFLGVQPNPDTTVVVEGLKQYRETNADVLIAIGGGSAIDAAKGILYFDLFLEDSKREGIEKPLFIAIPSTSGTGSEVTDFSVITAENKKVVIIDRLIAPDIAVLDSDCVKHVPPHVIVDAGIDVLVHAIEAYVSTKANDFTDALAEKSIKLIFENLEAFYKDPENECVRDRVHNASCIAGMAFTNAGLGINHSLAHTFGETFHIAHGRSNAFLMNAIIEFNAEIEGSAKGYAAERYAKLAHILQLPARTYREGTINLLSAIDRLKKALDIEENIRTRGIDKAQFESALENMAETALLDRCTPTNPRQPSKEDLIQILRKSYG